MLLVNAENVALTVVSAVLNEVGTLAAIMEVVKVLAVPYFVEIAVVLDVVVVVVVIADKSLPRSVRLGPKNIGEARVAPLDVFTMNKLPFEAIRL